MLHCHSTGLRSSLRNSSRPLMDIQTLRSNELDSRGFVPMNAPRLVVSETREVRDRLVLTALSGVRDTGKQNWYFEGWERGSQRSCRNPIRDLQFLETSNRVPEWQSFACFSNFRTPPDTNAHWCSLLSNLAATQNAEFGIENQ